MRSRIRAKSQTGTSGVDKYDDRFFFRSLTQAIAAAQSGNTPSLLHEIKTMRKLLKQEHADVDKDDDDKEKKTKSRIDKLAARALDFDFKYVEKRVKGEKD